MYKRFTAQQHTGIGICVWKFGTSSYLYETICHLSQCFQSSKRDFGDELWFSAFRVAMNENGIKLLRHACYCR